MPHRTIPLPVNYAAISRPVCASVARDVMAICNIPPDTALYMPGEFEVSNQETGKMGTSKQPLLSGTRRVHVIADDTTRSASLLNRHVMSNEIPTIFNDPELGISVRPVYVESDITLDFTYVCSTRQEAIKWKDDFAIAQSQHRSSIQHEISYNIPMQDDIVARLAHFHELREKIAGYGESFEEYFQRIQCREISCTGTRDGDPNKLSFAVPEKQAQITGYFSFDDLPKEQKMADSTVWEIKFTYHLCYRRATHFYMVYPLLIHQQWINRAYYSSTPRFSVEELPKRGDLVVEALDWMDGSVDNLPPITDGLRVPYFDEWIPSRGGIINRSVPIISWLIQLDPKDPQDILNLTQLPDMRFTLEMDTYLKMVHSKLHRQGMAGVFFTLYIDDVAMDSSILTIDKDLNVRAVRPLDMRHQYHLRLNIPTWWYGMSQDALIDLSKNSDAAEQIFNSIYPGVVFPCPRDEWIDGVFIPISCMEHFYKDLEDKGIGYLPPSGGPGGPIHSGEAGALKSNRGLLHYVQYLAIMTKKRTDEGQG